MEFQRTPYSGTKKEDRIHYHVNGTDQEITGILLELQEIFPNRAHSEKLTAFRLSNGRAFIFCDESIETKIRDILATRLAKSYFNQN